MIKTDTIHFQADRDTNTFVDWTGHWTEGLLVWIITADERND